MPDWDPVTRPIIAAAMAGGIKTTAMVEGIQDYENADVHWKRHAYQLCDTVILPGAFDARYFTDSSMTQNVTPVGVARIQSLRQQSPKPAMAADATPKVLINCTFSCGVLEKHRDTWLTQSVKAVLAAGMEPVISRHPADKGELFPEYLTQMAFY